MKSIAQLREKAPYVLNRNGHAKQIKKLRKAYHGKRLKELWSSYASWECCTIAELKDAEHVGHRMKGGHRHNHIYNACHRIVFRGKGARRVDRDDKIRFVATFYTSIMLNKNSLTDILKKKWRKNGK